MLVNVYSCFHGHDYYSFSSSAIANPSSPRTLPFPSCPYIASSSLNHTHPHDRRTSSGNRPARWHPPFIWLVVGLPFVAPVYTHEHLMYASFCTAPTTIRTLNDIPSPSFPFPLQHLSWISYFHALSPYSKSPVADLPHAHRRGTPTS